MSDAQRTSNPNICYCGAYGGGVHTRSARCPVPSGKDQSPQPSEEAELITAGEARASTPAARTSKTDFAGVTAEQSRSLPIVDQLRYWFDPPAERADAVGMEAADEIERLQQRCNPSKVVVFDGIGHYVSEAVFTEIERLQRERDELRQDLEHRERYWAQFDHIPKGAAEPPSDAWLIFFDDYDRKPEVFAGEGAEDAARRRFEQISMSWSAHLFARVANNCARGPSTKTTSPGETK